MKNYFITKDFIIASILDSKIDNYDERFVTNLEVNTVSDVMQSSFNKKNLTVKISDSIDRSDFYIHDGLFVLKDGISVLDYVERYKSYIPRRMSEVLFNKDLVLSIVRELKDSSKLSKKL